MPFKPGKSGNPNGRPPGKPNSETLQLRDFIQIALDNDREKFIRELNKLSGLEYVRAYIKLLEYIVPKLNRTELKTETINLTREPCTVIIVEPKTNKA